MSIEIKVPVLPESVADALLLDWSKQVGDTVRRDEVLVEVETDKIVLEVPAPHDGVLTEIIEQTGTTVFANQVLARIEPSEARTAAVGEEIEVEKPSSEQSASESPLISNDALANNSLLSPAVRRLIDETGIEPNTITASGRDGRLTKEDVLNHIADAVEPSAQPASSAETASESRQVADAVEPSTQPASSAETASESRQVADAVDPSTQPASSAETASESRQVADVVEPSTQSASSAETASENRQETRQPMSRLQQTVAKRLLYSQQNAALLTTFNEVNMQAVIALRTKYKEKFEKKHAAKLGFMSFFVKASSIALQRFPLLNAYIDGTDIVQHGYADIGIAVSSPRGLVVPVLRDCELLSYAEIESQIQGFAVRAAAGKITMDELNGGTFTITNGGVFGSLLSTPIVNPPQSAILGMHKIQQRPMAENGEVVILPMMYLALSYDHRIIDGQEAVQFLVAVKQILEDPARGLLDC